LPAIAWCGPRSPTGKWQSVHIFSSRPQPEPIMCARVRVRQEPLADVVEPASSTRCYPGSGRSDDSIELFYLRKTDGSI
jgi:hypothetical protein